MRLRINRRYSRTRKELQNIRKRGGFERIIKEEGFIKIIHLGLLLVLLYIRRLLYRKKNISNSYGFVEAIFYPYGIDYWCRYADIVGEINKLSKNFEGRRFSILDCGAGGEGISKFLNAPCIFLLDVRKDVFMNIKNKNVQPIVGDITRLPLKDHSIDILVSSATIEHISRNVRTTFFVELKRVCKSTIILHFPVESADGLFRGREYDIRFQNAHKANFGSEEPTSTQHINLGHPRIDEVRKIFPNSRIIGRKNCDVWLKYMILSRKSLIGFLTGLTYYLFWKRKDDSPPFYECMTLWSRACPQRVTHE